MAATAGGQEGAGQPVDALGRVELQPGRDDLAKTVVEGRPVSLAHFRLDLGRHAPCDGAGKAARDLDRPAGSPRVDGEGAEQRDNDKGG